MLKTVSVKRKGKEATHVEGAPTEGIFFLFHWRANVNFLGVIKKREGVAIMFATIPCGPLSSKIPLYSKL